METVGGSDRLWGGYVWLGRLDDALYVILLEHSQLERDRKTELEHVECTG